MQGQIKTIEKIDAVWDRIRHEAEAITRAEPAMGAFIFSSILAHDTFETALDSPSWRSAWAMRIWGRYRRAGLPGRAGG